jgi:hypothetical protein
VSNALKKCNAKASRLTRKKWAVELIDMQEAFVELAQGVWGKTAGLWILIRNDCKRRHCDRNLLVVPRERMGGLVVLLLAERAR